MTIMSFAHTRAKCEIRMIILVTDHANDGILARVVCKFESRRLISIQNSNSSPEVFFSDDSSDNNIL